MIPDDARIVTLKDVCRDVAEEWKSAYRNSDGTWCTICSGDAKSIYDSLLALGDEPWWEDVDEAVGNDSWSMTPECTKCEANDRNSRLVFTNEKGWEESYCMDCLHNMRWIVGVWEEAKKTKKETVI